jgi:predicted ABC-type transport system involved in lysophospholipase L1 biosynthesis ATPase subunit
MSSADPVVRLAGVVKEYRGLRPLRVDRLELHPGESCALLGFDQVTAEVLVDLITGATVPDSGLVEVFGQPTSAIADADAWLVGLDRFGLLSERAVLVEQFTAEQNLILPLSLNLERVADELRTRVRRITDEVGLPGATLERPAGGLSALDRARVRLGRALALDPQVLLAEHPSATLSPGETSVFATDLSRVIRGRGLAALLLTADAGFAAAAAAQVLTLRPATGHLERTSGWRRWFS